MLLNIDLGSLYLKTSIIDEDNDEQVLSEIIKMERDQRGVAEVLINTLIDKYDEEFGVSKVNILPNLEYIEIELRTVDSILENKYQAYMKKEIKEELKLQRRNRNLTDSQEMNTRRLGTGEQRFELSSYDLETLEISHTIEDSDIMTTDIYLEFIDKEYLAELTSMVNMMGKEVSVISPIRRYLYIPFPKKNRVIVDYGHKHIVMIAIEVDKRGEQVIKKLVKNTIEHEENKEEYYLTDKHGSSSQINNNIFSSSIKDIKDFTDEYPDYELFTIGGMSGFVQSDMIIKNYIEDFKMNRHPLTLENLLLPVTFGNYKSIQHNTKGMNLKNKFVNIMNTIKDTFNEIAGAVGSLAAVGAIMLLITSYGVGAEYLHYKSLVESKQTRVSTYESANGTLSQLEDKYNDLREGKTRNYYNIAEFLDTISSPLEFKEITIDGKNIKIVADADNLVLIQQFVNTVRIRQASNEFTKFSIDVEDISTIYKNGRKVDRVVFRGTIY